MSPRSIFVPGAAALLAAVSACGGDCLEEDPAGTTVRFEDPEQSLPDLLAHPWPSDGLRRDGPRLRLDHFPNPTQSTTLDDYLEVIGRETGAFAVSAALYLGFTGPIDPASLPADPRAALEAGATVQLVDVDPSSPERGRRYPLRLRFGAERSLYLPANHLAVLPPFGATLRGGTTYALVVFDGVRDAGGEALVPTARARNLLVAGCPEPSGAGRLSAGFAALRSWLEGEGKDPTRVAGATVFTTQAAVQEVRALVTAARAQPAPTASNWARRMPWYDSDRYSAEIDLPGFQSGRIPYRGLDDGGALARDASGAFLVDHQERTRIGVTVPINWPMPENGWPVVLYAHGTGGSFDNTYEVEISDRLGRLGIAVVGYDQTLHGPRDPTGSDPNLTFFNLFNPVAARDNIRQGAADLAVMTTLIGSLVVPADVTMKGEARFDPTRIAFLGHSQGSLVGAPYWAADGRARAAVYSGLGAILSITLQERKDIVDFAALLASLLQLPAEEALDDFHPVLNLIQTFIEPADPIAFARSYLSDPAEGRARDLLMIEGFLDFASPARGQEAFAAAAGLPVIAPVHRVPEAAQILGIAGQEAPARQNVSSAAGPVTYGLIQYPEQTHYPIYDDRDANRRFLEFMRTALLEPPALIAASE